jgi:hypothetical protein
VVIRLALVSFPLYCYIYVSLDNGISIKAKGVGIIVLTKYITALTTDAPVSSLNVAYILTGSFEGAGRG